MKTELRYGKPEEAGMLPERVALARERAEQWVKSGHTPSLAVLAARRGVICLHEAFGVLRAEEPDSPPLELDSLFPLASLTKPLVATLAHAAGGGRSPWAEPTRSRLHPGALR